LGTPANAEGFRVNFVDNLDLGNGDFLTKLRGQIGEQPEGAIRMAAEA
jgi:hypothetical protein